MKFRKLTLILIAVLLFSVGFTALNGCKDDNTVYKSATVLSVSGEARVHRGDGSLPAYKGLSLRHGDTLSTEKDAVVTVALNGDKYALIEPNSTVNFSLYENETEKVALITLAKGAVYVEADTSAEDGLIFGTQFTSQPQASVLGGEVAYRVKITEDKPSATLIQVLFGAPTFSLSETSSRTLSAGTEYRIDRNSNGEVILPITESDLDRYTLPYRYIELDENGVFGPEGELIQRPLSGDLSLKGITVNKADGSEVPLFPEFDNGIAGYVIETDAVAKLTVIANHPKTRLKIQCHTALSVKTEENTGEAVFSENEPFHAVSILVIAEDGSEIQFSVNIIITK